MWAFIVMFEQMLKVIRNWKILRKKIKTGQVKKSIRVYNSNWSQHVSRRHFKEKTISEILTIIDKKEYHRRMCLERLEHNHQYNMIAISKNSGEIFSRVLKYQVNTLMKNINLAQFCDKENMKQKM